MGAPWPSRPRHHHDLHARPEQTRACHPQPLGSRLGHSPRMDPHPPSPHAVIDEKCSPFITNIRLILVRWLCALVVNDADSRSMIATTLLSRSLASRFHRLRESQTSQQQRARRMIRTSRRGFSSCPALAVLPRLFPEFWFDASRATERSLIPDHVFPRLPSEPRPPPNQAMERTATRLAFTRCVTTLLLVLSSLASGRRRSSCSR